MEHGGFILWYSKSYGKAASLDILKRSIILNHHVYPQFFWTIFNSYVKLPEGKIGFAVSCVEHVVINGGYLPYMYPPVN